MSRTVYLDGERRVLAASRVLAEGGEAEVHDLGGGLVGKLWKAPDHPDYTGLPEAQAAARERLRVYPAKLDALAALAASGRLPAGAITPTGRISRDKRGVEVIGFAMARIAGEPLHAWSEAAARRRLGVTPAQVVRVLLALRVLVEAVHQAGVVIGDFNDLNVLVDGDTPALIDLDSAQLGGWACPMFTDRFVDPRLLGPCAPALAASRPGLDLARPHDVGSDWFAFAVMAFRSLVGVHPYGGVHRPPAPARPLPPLERARQGVTVAHPDVVYPRSAPPLQVLPAPVLAWFEACFSGGVRVAMPTHLLAGLRFATCSGCGLDHARAACPRCVGVTVTVPAATVRGALRVVDLALTALAPSTVEVDAGDRAGAAWWWSGDTLWRRGVFGPERVGAVLGGQARCWIGPAFGVGFYRAGGLTVGFLVRPDRAGLDDRVALPPMRGQLVAAHATLSAGRAWLGWTTAFAGRLHQQLVVLDRAGAVLAHADVDVAAAAVDPDLAWMAGLAGAVAAGDALFVPTDDGLVRVELVAGAPAVTRTFADTRGLVGPADVLHLGPRGLDVVRAGRALRLELTP